MKSFQQLFAQIRKTSTEKMLIGVECTFAALCNLYFLPDSKAKLHKNVKQCSPFLIIITKLKAEILHTFMD